MEGEQMTNDERKMNSAQEYILWDFKRAEAVKFLIDDFGIDDAEAHDLVTAVQEKLWSGLRITHQSGAPVFAGKKVGESPF